MQIMMQKCVALSHTAMEVEIVQRNQDAKALTSEVGQKLTASITKLIASFEF